MWAFQVVVFDEFPMAREPRALEVVGLLMLELLRGRWRNERRKRSRTSTEHAERTVQQSEQDSGRRCSYRRMIESVRFGVNTQTSYPCLSILRTVSHHFRFPRTMLPSRASRMPAKIARAARDRGGGFLKMKIPSTALTTTLSWAKVKPLAVPRYSMVKSDA
jgi:hypothetical protein